MKTHENLVNISMLYSQDFQMFFINLINPPGPRNKKNIKNATKIAKPMNRIFNEGWWLAKFVMRLLRMICLLCMKFKGGENSMNETGFSIRAGSWQNVPSTYIIMRPTVIENLGQMR